MKRSKKIGVDIGGTFVKGALFTDDKIVKEASVPTNGLLGREAIFAALFTVLDELYEEDVEIGVCSAGNIDPERGVCVYATDSLVGWEGANIKAEVDARYHTDCLVDNDTICALRAELKFYPGKKNVTMLTFGTGLGGACLVNGEILRGAHYGAGRWGHVSLVSNGRRCSCGRNGCAEAYLSAQSLYLRGRRKLPGLKDCIELFDLYRAKQRDANGLLHAFGGELNTLLDDIRMTFSPELIILGGGMMESRDVIEPLLSDTSDIAFARLSSRAGIYGAIEELKRREEESCDLN